MVSRGVYPASGPRRDTQRGFTSRRIHREADGIGGRYRFQRSIEMLLGKATEGYGFAGSWSPDRSLSPARYPIDRLT